MKKDIEGIVFDLGGVLVGNFNEVFFENVSKALGVSKVKIKKAIKGGALLLQKGRESSLDFWKRICKKLNIDVPPDKVLLSLWVKGYRENAKLNNEMVGLVKELSKKYPLGIISNTIKEHADINKKRSLFKYFKVVLLSNEVGLMKPQKEIFQLTAKKMGIIPSKILFVDDDLRWVKAARDLGFQSVRFTSPNQIKNKFKMLNIL